MHPDTLEQLARRLDAQHAHVCAQLEALRGELAALRGDHARLEGDLRARFERHARYHDHNEPHWGPERLAQRHPFRTALLAAAGGGLMVSLAPRSLELLEALLRRLAGL